MSARSIPGLVIVVVAVALIVEPSNQSQVCPNGYLSITGSGQCFKLINEPTSRDLDAARVRCARDGLMLARPDDSIAVALRKHLIENNGLKNGCAWVDARGTGSNMAWMGDTAPVDRDLIAPWDRDDVATKWCMGFWVWDATLEEYPQIPYGVWSCSDSFPVLCQKPW